ncbi:MAG: hypothetical protein M3362_26605, partial [Acidobacteriota bacterium]|nr:hypothetical protein [Acidobacteriota bacterium]
HCEREAVSMRVNAKSGLIKVTQENKDAFRGLRSAANMVCKCSSVSDGIRMTAEKNSLSGRLRNNSEGSSLASL